MTTRHAINYGIDVDETTPLLMLNILQGKGWKLLSAIIINYQQLPDFDWEKNRYYLTISSIVKCNFTLIIICLHIFNTE